MPRLGLSCRLMRPLPGEPPFPSPTQMIERTFVGNVAFEGDVREETEGSRVIAQAILDDDPRTLWLLSWGGMNTIVRALMSIAERYRATPEWPSVQQCVYQKVRVMGVADGVGQDNSWLDHGHELFPDLIFWCVPYMYGGYVDAKDGSARYAAAVPGSLARAKSHAGQRSPYGALYALWRWQGVRKRAREVPVWQACPLGLGLRRHARRCNLSAAILWPRATR